MFTTLASLLVTHRRLTLVAWVLFVAVAVIVGRSAIDRLVTDAEGDTVVESAVADARLEAIGQAAPDVVAFIDGIDPTDPETRLEIQSHVDRLTALPHVVDVVDPSTAGPLLVSTDGQAILVAVTIDPTRTEAEYTETVHAVEAELRTVAAERVLIGGQALLDEESVEQTEADLQKAELVSLPVVLVLAILIFGGVLAATMPVIVALIAIPGTLLVLRLLTELTDIHVFALNAATMLGLGLAVDYALLIVNRFREERGAGLEVDAAVRRTVETAGVTVAFSGLTVAVALGGFLMLSGNVFPSIGLGSMGVVLLAMIVALTLLPAILASFGHRIRPASTAGGHRFRRIARSVQARPAVTALAVTTGLLVLATPFLGVRLQIPGAEALPASLETRQVFDERENRFLIGGDDPITVLADVTDPAAIEDYVGAITAIDDVLGVDVRDATDGVVVVDVLAAGAAQSATAEGVVADIRALDTDFETAVTGPAATLADQRDALYDRLPWALGFVAAATLVLLFLLTGSVVVPIKALVMNMLSLTATFGVLVWGFQDGHLAGALGFDDIGYLSLWLPFLVFFIAFGLSMDYEVFLLARIKEIYDETGDNDHSVAEGLQRTGQIITSAALLIGVVFGAFATGAGVEMKALGIGLALAIVLDATVVRTLLVPATMRLMGDWNWWAPGPLRRIHDRFGFHEPRSTPRDIVVEPPAGIRGLDHDVLVGG
jgi:RND superfamily putative drug exporter